MGSANFPFLWGQIVNHESPILRGWLLLTSEPPILRGRLLLNILLNDPPILRGRLSTRLTLYLDPLLMGSNYSRLTRAREKEQDEGSILRIKTQPPRPAFPLTYKLVGCAPNYALTLSGKGERSRAYACSKPRTKTCATNDSSAIGSNLFPLRD